MEGLVPLTDTGKRQVVLFNTHIMAEDENGNLVPVIASQEAILDKGEPAVFQMASDKFDAGQTEHMDGATVVRVTTGDF
jgi:hypothetical protein